MDNSGASVTASAFQQSFGLLSDKARHEPVIITKHGRASLVIMAAEEWERLKRRDMQPLRALDDEAMRTARLFLDSIKKPYDVFELFAFGSRARGDSRADSDLDLAVILNGARKDFLDTKLDMANRAFDVLMETGILVQPLPLWKDDVLHPERFSNPALIKNILAEGVRLS